MTRPSRNDHGGETPESELNSDVQCVPYFMYRAHESAMG